MAVVFIDRVVLFVDGHEVRPTSAEYLPPFGSSLALSSLKGQRLAQGRPSANPASPALVEGLATYRLRGRMPADARTLRWYYGLVIDPYPLTIRRVDGRAIVDWVGGNSWSRPLDLSGQFRSAWVAQAERQLPIVIMVGMFFAALMLRIGSTRSRTPSSPW